MELNHIKGQGGITAAVVADSFNTSPSVGVRLLTLQLRYPRFIHAEFMTHRVFSRNASSSRAIPVAKMIEQVRKEPAMPIHWGKNQPGMQARAEVEDTTEAIQSWRRAARQAADIAEHMNAIGLHKQVANRILEPFQFINVIVSATEWTNFFALRDHEDADPTIRELAVTMKRAIDESKSVTRRWVSGVSTEEEWHLPYITDKERKLLRLEALIQCSAARCARVSYNTHDGATPDPEQDMALYERLVGSKPIHASPVEHQARCSERSYHYANFQGWQQHRETVEKQLA